MMDHTHTFVSNYNTYIHTYEQTNDNNKII